MGRSRVCLITHPIPNTCFVLIRYIRTWPDTKWLGVRLTSSYQRWRLLLLLKLFLMLRYVQNTRVSETEEFRKSYRIESLSPSNLNTISDPVMCFRGWREDPRWLDEERRLFFFLLFLSFDVHPCDFRVVFDVVLCWRWPISSSETREILPPHPRSLLWGRIWCDFISRFDRIQSFYRVERKCRGFFS